MGFDTLDRDRAGRTMAVKRRASLIPVDRHKRGMAAPPAEAGFNARP